MCGIIGVYNSSFNTDTYIDMLVHWRRKGKDGVGLLWKLNDEVKYLKDKNDPVNFVINKGKHIKNIYESEPEFMLYHTRAATIGKVTKDGIHPFIGKRYIVMQNGTVMNHKKIPINKEWTYKAGSDTEKITAYLNIDDGKNIVQKLKVLTNLVHIIGVLVIYDIKEDKLYLYRDPSRELVLTSDELGEDYKISTISLDDDDDEKGKYKKSVDDLNFIKGFFNSYKLAKRFIPAKKLIMVEPYTLIETTTDGEIIDIYEIRKRNIHVGGAYHYGTNYYFRR